MSPYKLLTGRGLALKLAISCLHILYIRQYDMFNFTFIYIQVWDSTILQTEVDNFYDSDMNEFIDALQQNITVLYAILF